MAMCYVSVNLVQALPVVIQRHVLGIAAPSVTPVFMRTPFTPTVTPSGPHPATASAAPVSGALLNVSPVTVNKHRVLYTFPTQDRYIGAQVHPEFLNTPADNLFLDKGVSICIHFLYYI